MHLVVAWRREGSQCFTAHRQMSQTMALHIRSELESYLRGHERVCHSLLVKIASQLRQVQSHVFGNDAHRRSACQCRVHIHHIGIETERSICRHLIAGVEIVVPVVPVAERHKVTMLQHHALRHTR